MLVRIDDVLTLRNKPSDGSMRRVSNAILLVEKDKAEQQPEEESKPTTPPTTPATTPSATTPVTVPGAPEPVRKDNALATMIGVGAAVVIGAGVAVAVIGKKRKK